MTEPGDSPDPDEADLELIRAEHDRQRRYALSILPIGLGLAGALVEVVVMGLDGLTGAWAVLSWVGLAMSVVLLAWGGMWMRRSQPDAVTERFRTRANYREQRQRARTNSLVFAVVPSIGVLCVGLPAAWKIVSGNGEWINWPTAAVLALMPVVVGLMVAGIGTGETPKTRVYLDDELTRAIRARALATGYVVLLAGATTIYLMGLWRPAVATILAPLALTAGVGASAIHFALLEREAERDG